MTDKLNFTCIKCGQKTPIEKPYAFVQAFKEQPMYNYLEMYCPCGCMWRVFCTAEVLTAIKVHGGLEIKWGKYATEEIIRAFAQTYFSDRLKPDENDLVEFFHHVLETTEGVEDIIEWR